MSKNPSLTQQISLLGQPDAASAHSDGVCKEIPQLVWGNSLTGRVLGCSSHPAAEGQHQTCQQALQAGLCFPPPAEDSHFRKHLMASTLISLLPEIKAATDVLTTLIFFFFKSFEKASCQRTAGNDCPKHSWLSWQPSKYGHCTKSLTWRS